MWLMCFWLYFINQSIKLLATQLCHASLILSHIIESSIQVSIFKLLHKITCGEISRFYVWKKYIRLRKHFSFIHIMDVKLWNHDQELTSKCKFQHFRILETYSECPNRHHLHHISKLLIGKLCMGHNLRRHFLPSLTCVSSSLTCQTFVSSSPARTNPTGPCRCYIRL